MATILGVKPGTLEGTEELADRTLRRTYRRTYLVQSDDTNDREPSILNTAGLPTIKSAFAGGHDSDDGSLCVRRTARLVDKTKLTWEVECEFSPDASEEEEEEEDPLDLPVEVEWDFETIEEVVEKDTETEEAIATSAGEKFADPPVTRPRAIPILTLTRYELTFEPTTILNYVNRVNDAEFYGAEEKQVLCAGIRARKVSVKGRRLWTVTYVFKFNLEPNVGWRRELLDRGSYSLFDEEKVPFTDAYGNPRMGNLDGNGGENADGEEFLTFDVFQTADFSAFNIA